MFAPRPIDNSVPISPIFGFHEANYPALFNITGYSSLVGIGVLAGVFTVTVAKIVPLFAIIGGLFRIYAAHNGKGDADERDLPTLNGHIYRGIGECFGLGALFLFVDIYATFLHNRCCNQTSK